MEEGGPRSGPPPLPSLPPIKGNAHTSVSCHGVTTPCNAENKLDSIEKVGTMKSMILLRSIPHTNGAVTIEQHVTPEGLLQALSEHLERGRWVSLATASGSPVRVPDRIPERSLLRGAGRAHLTPIRP